MNFRFLLQPIKIGNLTIENRIVMPAINQSYTTDGKITDRLIAYYRRRAEGGTGLITLGGCAVLPVGRSSNIICIYDDSFITGLQKITAAVHKENGKISAQLYHAGGYAKTADIHEQAVAPSEFKSRYTNEISREMTKEEISNTINAFADAALRAKVAGFDAIELIASAGYLIAEFLSPFTNKRTDEYGGSIENRAKFLIDIIRAVKGKTNNSIPVIVRMGGNDFIKGGNTNKEAVQVASMVERAGCDAINMTGGWHEAVIPQTTGELPGGGLSYLSRNIKEAVNIPVMISNRVNTPENAEFLIASGMADIVSMGRALIADPDFVKKLSKGHPELIRRCIACGQGCYDRRFTGKDVMCMINYEAGREDTCSASVSENKKKILVIGGGVAGMEFATKAAGYGHEVTIWESSSSLGGQLHIAQIPEGKHDFKYFADYLEQQCKNCGIKLELNKKADKQSILDFGADCTVIATGSNPRPVPFPVTMQKENIMQANDVLSGNCVPGKKIVVIGGGAVGCETAIYIADQSTLSAEQVKFLLVHDVESADEIKRLLNTPSRQVSIVEMLDKTAKGIGVSTKWVAKKHIKRLGIKEYTQSEVLEVNSEGVKIRQADGNTSLLEADTVVLATGSKSQNSLYEDLQGSLSELYIIGDAAKPGNIYDAVLQANELALKL